MNLNTMIGRVRSYIDESSEKNFSNAFIIESLNVGQDEIQSAIVALNIGYYEKPALINPTGTPPGTTPGVDRYLLPTDFLSFRRVEHADSGTPLRPIDLNEKTTYGMSLVSRLMPAGDGGYSYYRSGNDLVIDPVPQTAMPIRLIYVHLLTELTTSTAGTFECELPRQFHDMVCLAAAIDARIKDEAGTADLERKYNRQMRRLENSLGAWQTQEPKRVGGAANY